MTSEAWPRMSVDEWGATLDTVRTWCGLVGRTRLALARGQGPGWDAPLYVTSAGLTTSLMPLGVRGGLEVVLDLQAHQLVMRLTDGRDRRMRLARRSGDDLGSEYLARLAELEVEVELGPWPAGRAAASPVPENAGSASYDAHAVQQYFRALVSAHRVLTRFRGDLRGRPSPVQFSWGAFDLAVTLVSGRPAPAQPDEVPHRPHRVVVEANRQELSRCGYWPGGADEGLFFVHVHPQPRGFRDHAPTSVDAYFDEDLGEFVLPYADVRRAVDPDAHALRFVTEIHAVATADWPVA